MSLVKAPREIHAPTGQIVRYVFAGGKPPIHAAVAVASAFRAAALSALHATTGTRESFLLSGHRADGSVDRSHEHAYYLPQPGKDGTLVAMLVVSPRFRFSSSELAALEVVKALRWNGPGASLSLDLLSSDDTAPIQVASRWVSATPYVPLRRFWGTHGKRHLTPERQLFAELKEARAVERLKEVSVESWGDILVRDYNQGMRGRSGSARRAFKIEFELPEPVCGPIALGHSCHFGLGLFTPNQ